MITYKNTYEIRKHKIHKDYVFLLSVHDGCAFWSAHEYAGDPRAPIGVLATLFQKAHDNQVNGMIKEALQKEAQEYMELTIEQDKKSLDLIDSLPEEKRKLLLDQFNKPLGGEDEKL